MVLSFSLSLWTCLAIFHATSSSTSSSSLLSCPFKPFSSKFFTFGPVVCRHGLMGVLFLILLIVLCSWCVVLYPLFFKPFGTEESCSQAAKLEIENDGICDRNFNRDHRKADTAGTAVQESGKLRRGPGPLLLGFKPELWLKQLQRRLWPRQRLNRCWLCRMKTRLIRPPGPRHKEPTVTGSKWSGIL